MRIRTVLGTLGVAAIAALTLPITPASTVSAQEQPAPCYEQVTLQKYKRPVFKTEYKYVKEIRERSRTDANAAWGDWTDWALYNGGSVNQWQEDGFVSEGLLQDNTTYQLAYRYVKSGQTRSEANGFEHTDWVSSPPDGEGWVPVGQPKVEQGNRIPCPRPEAGFIERTDQGTCSEPGDTTATVTVYRTPFTFELRDLFEWVQTFGDEAVFSTSERDLTPEELASEACLLVEETTTTTTIVTDETTTTTTQPGDEETTTTTAAPTTTTTVVIVDEVPPVVSENPPSEIVAYNCAAFNGDQVLAQEWFIFYVDSGRLDLAGALDADDDGIACEADVVASGQLPATGRGSRAVIAIGAALLLAGAAMLLSRRLGRMTTENPQ